ncbi:MAG: globin domain-containing protein [Vicinamibacterales bacterium]|jgi:hemoglobin-like flavoprotein|nr:globin domain-containing protein [Vicinamibacterales bacterium]HJN45276.1 globin domain-containing protein [Vicinamibacterales bacterium]|tara:strand:- start:2464 stop:2886 length:423 start_codon:yes stop_codon:yes gene_type:complete
MALEVQLLRDSFVALTPRHGELLQTFYDTLFERYPQVRPLFAKNDMSEQRKNLGEAPALVVANLERPDVLTQTLHRMGARHVAYGAEPPHYDAVGECLLHALAVTAGPLWNDELADAWAGAYGAVADLMKQGAAQTAKAS